GASASQRSGHVCVGHFRARGVPHSSRQTSHLITPAASSSAIISTSPSARVLTLWARTLARVLRSGSSSTSLISTRHPLPSPPKRTFRHILLAGMGEEAHLVKLCPS